MGFSKPSISQPKVEPTPVPTIDPATIDQHADIGDKDTDTKNKAMKKAGKKSLRVEAPSTAGTGLASGKKGGSGLSAGGS